MAGKPGELPKEIPVGSGNWFWEDGSAVTPAEVAELQNQASGGAPSPGTGIDTGVRGQGPLDDLIPKKIRADAPGASLDTTLAQESRDGLSGLLEQLQQQAATGGGSWENVLKAATQRSQATASALGQSSTGAGGGYQSALRDIGNAQSSAAQRAVGQGNILREQSKATSQDQLGDLILGVGGQDVAQAANEAAVKQGVRSANLSSQQSARNMALGAIGGAGQALMSDGGKVPGRAKVFGDDEANDTVPAMLSPGEVVLPRTVAQDPDAAADFVRSLNASRGVRHMAAGGFLDNKGDPSGLETMSLEEVMGGGGIQAPSVENGGRLRDEQALAGHANMQGLAPLIAARAAGQGGTAPQMLVNAGDDAIARAQAGGGGPGSIGAAVAGQQQAGGQAAATAGNEQAAAGRSLAHALTGQRANDLALAGAQQKAAWQNTLTNAGVTLENQALMTRLFSGAGQGLGALSRAGGGDKGFSLEDSSTSGDIKDTGYLPESGAGPEYRPDELWQGGTVGYAEGGEIEADLELDSGQKVKFRGEPQAPKRRELTDVMHAKTPQELPSERQARKAREYEEETGDEKPVHAKKKPKAEPDAMAKLTAFAQSLGAMMPRKFAEGGGVSDAGGRPPFDPYAFDAQRGAPPVVYVSTTPVPGTQPLQLGGAGGGSGGGGAPSGAGGGTSTGDYGAAGAGGASGATPMDRGSAGATGGPAGNQIPQHEAIQPRAERPPSGGTELPPGVVPKGTPTPTPDPGTPPPAPTTRVGGGVALPPSHGLEEGFVANETQLAAQAQTDAEVARARAEQLGLAEKAKAQADAQIAMKEAHARARQQASEAMTRWTAAQEEFNRIDTKVDSGRYWASKSTPNKILSIIGLALGAAGAGVDGINRTAAMMNHAIDRDLEAQKAQTEAALRKGGQKLTAAQNYYAMAREAGHDDIAATELAKAAALDAAALRAEQMVASINEPIAKAKGQMFAAALRSGALEKKKAGEQQTFENKVKNQTLSIQATAAAHKGGLGEGEKGKVFDVEAATRNIRSNIAKAKNIIDRYGTYEAFGGQEQELYNALQDIAIDSARMKDPGSTVKEGELANAQRALGFEAGTLTTSNDTAKRLLDAFAAGIEGRRKNALEVRGIRAQ